LSNAKKNLSVFIFFFFGPKARLQCFVDNYIVQYQDCGKN